MTRRMMTLAAVAVIGLATAAVGFGQRQPAGATGERQRPGAGSASASDRAGAGQGRHARATFEVYKDKSGDYRWRLRATNTQILAIAAQGYSDKRACLNAIESVKRDVADAPVEEKEQPAAAKEGDEPAKEAAGAGTSGGANARKAK